MPGNQNGTNIHHHLPSRGTARSQRAARVSKAGVAGCSARRGEGGGQTISARRPHGHGHAEGDVGHYRRVCRRYRHSVERAVHQDGSVAVQGKLRLSHVFLLRSFTIRVVSAMSDSGTPPRLNERNIPRGYLAASLRLLEHNITVAPLSHHMTLT